MSHQIADKEPDDSEGFVVFRFEHALHPNDLIRLFMPLPIVGKCFMDWLEHRGDDQDIEEKKILSKIQLFFEVHGDSRFSS